MVFLKSFVEKFWLKILVENVVLPLNESGISLHGGDQRVISSHDDSTYFSSV